MARVLVLGLCAAISCIFARGSSTCNTDTGTACSVGGVNTCGQTTNEVMCSNGKCTCAEGFCTSDKRGNYGLLCKPSPELLERMKKAQTESFCSQDTSGTCNFAGCNAWRGPTNCLKQGWFYHCICQPGYCAKNGVCVSALNEPSNVLVG
eukprot:TRINITY_DN2979_c0_g1_i3.p1 TRINITY_DN2979_c0_g1~~TRINITY_DN2979_c0_g1_i3.p1  ORF type:complete len:150 (-),score=16.76 TRINITY_DN2979_c0_g1_i3:224-673(-)